MMISGLKSARKSCGIIRIPIISASEKGEEVENMSYSEKNRGEKTGYLQRVCLFYLIGFLVGAFFYYFFQNSFAALGEQMGQNAESWVQNGHAFAHDMLYSLWNHGRFFLLLWVLSVNRRASLWYQLLFAAYTGLRGGFLLLFFIFKEGARGILYYGASLFPQALLFAPLYLFCCYYIVEIRQGEHRGVVYALAALVFAAACFLEARCNLPLMENIL